ncbi:hypothetical protein [Harryflintia acetispora]|uniref:hypothetical protein n=1 Tax=Harryflintia acetispora TaxID=1849041 RepID=UPI002570EBB2|nr:hypothetical protein [Harryflintia acetispora]
MLSVPDSASIGACGAAPPDDSGTALLDDSGAAAGALASSDEFDREAAELVPLVTAELSLEDVPLVRTLEEGGCELLVAPAADDEGAVVAPPFAQAARENSIMTDKRTLASRFILKSPIFL